MTTTVMMGLLALFGILLAWGLFLVAADLLHLPYLRTSKAMVNTGREKRTAFQPSFQNFPFLIFCRYHIGS